jgi:hypothetical protein
MWAPMGNPRHIRAESNLGCVTLGDCPQRKDIFMRATDIDREYTKTGIARTIRFRDSKGAHVGSLLACGVDEFGYVQGFDLVKPDGTVLYCGVSCELVDSFADLLGWETYHID